MKEYYHSEGRYLKLDIALPYKEMCAEAFALIDKFTPHRSDEDSHGWESLTIHGLGWNKHENNDGTITMSGIDASGNPVKRDESGNIVPYVDTTLAVGN